VCARARLSVLSSGGRQPRQQRQQRRQWQQRRQRRQRQQRQQRRRRAWVLKSTCEGSTVMWGWEWYQPTTRVRRPADDSDSASEATAAICSGLLSTRSRLRSQRICGTARQMCATWPAPPPPSCMGCVLGVRRGSGGRRPPLLSAAPRAARMGERQRKARAHRRRHDVAQQQAHHLLRLSRVRVLASRQERVCRRAAEQGKCGGG
jgi:hypothetical protein